MSQQQQDPSQVIAFVLGQFGPLDSEQLKTTAAQYGVVGQVLTTTIRDGLNGKWIVRDGANFDVTPEYYTQERIEGANAAEIERVVEYDEPQQAQAAPVPVAPARPTAPAKPAAPKPTAPKATPAKPAAPKAKPAAPKATAAAPKATAAASQETDDEGIVRYYDRAMDTLTVEELNERIAIAHSAAEGNWNTGNYENQVVAEVLSRWEMRARRRVKSLLKGRTQVRQQS